MGMLHAGFGVGATLGPLMMTALVASDQSWRVGFVVFGVLQGILVFLYLRTRRAWSVAPAEPEAPRPFDRRRRGVLWGALAVFALYSGVEVGTGQWAFTLLTEGRGVSAGVAGAGVTAFWAGLTAARLGLGVVGHRVSINRTLGVASVLVAGSVAALWLTRSEWVSMASLVVMGVALGPIFPLQTTLTPGRVGVAYTPTAVGYQLAAATVGAALIPGGLGLLVSSSGLEVVAPVLLGTAVVLAGAVELLRRMVDSIPTREISVYPQQGDAGG
jgi:fucose permease